MLNGPLLIENLSSSNSHSKLLLMLFRFNLILSDILCNISLVPLAKLTSIKLSTQDRLLHAYLSYSTTSAIPSSGARPVRGVFCEYFWYRPFLSVYQNAL